MRAIREAVGEYAAGFDPALLSATDAQRILADTVAAENMLATVKGLAAKRVSDTEVWRHEGDVSAAHQLARMAGTSVARARETLDTAGRLAGLPELESAARRGELSPAQAAPIAGAASSSPGSQRRLLAAAAAASLGELLDVCARTVAAARPDDESRHRAVHASRFLRRRCTADGAGELSYRSTVEEVAEIFAVVQGWADRRFRTARAVGRHEPGEAYLADGLLDAVRGSRTAATKESASRSSLSGAAAPAGESPERKPPNPTKVIVRIDWDALVRGWPVDGEVSEIAGLGPVPVSAVRKMVASGDPFVAAVVTRGVDVVNVAHLGRRATAFQQTALEWRSPSCTTLGCNTAVRLENDHRAEWARTKVTLLSGLDRCCSHCHDRKTYRGWAYVEGTGKRPMVPPDDPRHPRNRARERGADGRPGAA